MSLMERVREIRADEAHVDDAQLNTARQALLQEIAGAARKPARRRLGLGIGLGGLVAAGVAGTIVLGSVLTPLPQSVPAASAAEILEEAAAVTITAVDTTLEPGQYLRIEARGEHLELWHAPWSDDGDENTFPFNWGDRARADAAVLVRETRTLYVPADRADEWLYDWGTREAVDSFGERADDARGEWEADPTNRSVDDRRVEALPAGEFLSPGADPAPLPYLVDSWRHHYDEMPRDPEALLDWFRARSGLPAGEADAWVFASVPDTLSINLMPAELRAAVFRALALVPGVHVVSLDGDLARLQYATAFDRSAVVVIDTAQGYIHAIEEDWGRGGVAGGLPSSSRSVEFSVVDSAPEPTE